MSSLWRICRTVSRKFSISHFNCARSWSFYIFDTCMTFLRLFRGIVYCGLHRNRRGGRKRLSRVSRSPSNVIFDLSYCGCVFQNLLPISVRKIPYKDGRSARKFHTVISRWLDAIIKALNVHFHSVDSCNE